MPLVKYRINEEKIKKIMVNGNITVSGFLDLINKKSSQKVTKCVFRGKFLDDNDLIRNSITSPYHVLILLTNTNEDFKDVMDLEQETKQNKKKEEVKNSVSSTLLFRPENNQNRKGFKYYFTIYTTVTSDSMFHGNKMSFSLHTSYSIIYNEIKDLIYNFQQISSKLEFDLHLFLPGGVHFKSGTLYDYYINPNSISFDNIYVIVVRKPKISYSIDDRIEEPCSCSDPMRQEIISPFCESSSAGQTQIASFLGYIFHGGLRSEHLLHILAKITRFAPLVVNLYRLIEKKPIIVLNILAITAPLFTLFRSILPSEIKNENVFEYTLNLMSLFDIIPTNDYLKIFELNTNDKKECEEVGRFAEYCKNTEQQQHVIVWTADTIHPDFKAITISQPFEIIENIFMAVMTFKPVAPLSLHYIFYPTFVRRNDDKSVMLYIKEVPDKDNSVLIIDPTKGIKEEINIEELANQVNVEAKEEVFSLIDPKKVDQIIFICFGEKTRSMLASEFLRALVKQSYSLRVSSFFGLISFGSNVKVLQPLTALSSEFIRSLKEINPCGKTLLYDAINEAQQQIINFAKLENGNSKYPNARFRIIVITDGADDKSNTLPEKLTNELIQNEIVVDTVLISLIDESIGCCTISKLTGGLSFRPKNLEDGIGIFEQEAFLNIKIRHMNPLPYNDEITSEIFTEESQNIKNQYASYAPNQMIINAKSNVTLATPIYMSYISVMKKIDEYRIKRAFIELNIISKNPKESYIVYSLYSTPEEWRIFIKGPNETPFANKWLNLYMVIPSNYPYEPPRFRFLTIPYHPNVSNEGTVVFSLNDRDYTSFLGIDSIIIGIIKLLKNPEENYAINQKAMELYKNNKNEFIKKQNESETGCEDYHQYLEGVKIYNEIPTNFNVPEENRNKSKVISITRDVINNVANKPVEVKDNFLLDINDYENIEMLGSGGFGYVYLVIEKSTNYEFAAKIGREINGQSEIFDYIKQVNVIANFNHGAIIKTYGYCLKDFFGDDKNVMIMEYLKNGDLNDIIEAEREGNIKEGWDYTQKMIVLYGIASGMAYIASYGVIHSDLKPQNILMTENLLPKITDFDTARLISENKAQSFNISGFEISTPLYTPPESIGDNEYVEKSDVYSYSMILYQVLTLLEPFPHTSRFDLYDKVVEGERPPIPDNIPLNLCNLIASCWKTNPEERPTFRQIADQLKSEEFLINVDSNRFLKYVEYLSNYKESNTKSKFIRPKTQVDKNSNINHKEQDEVLNQSLDIKIINLHDFNKENLIGKGRFSQVFRIEQKDTRFIYAAKISLQIVSEEVRQNILSEVTIMKSLDHPSILKFVGYSPINFEKENKPTIITEFASNGTLQNIINNVTEYKNWDDTKRLIIIFGIVAGMAYLHDNSIIHNDLKPSNILIDERFHPLIADFGLSQKVENIPVENSNKNTNFKGTPSYIAPEIWDEQKYSKASDVYSFGILLYELVYLKKAFDGLRPVQIGYKVTKKVRPLLPLLSLNVFKPLIQKCWDQDPRRRPTFNEIKNDLQNMKYVTKKVDVNEFKKYIKFIEDHYN